VSRSPLTTPPEQQALLDRIVSRFDSADKGVHARFRDRSNKFYALYRNYTEWKDGLPVDRRDRDLGLRDAKREWGAELFIPFSFSTVETVLARMLGQAPRVLVKPRNRMSEDNASNMKLTIDSQFQNIDYQLVLQDIGHDALILGLGVQKCYWNHRTGQSYKLEPGISTEWVAASVNRTLFDDPTAERVDPYDFFWDPTAANVNDCDWIIHRTWRSTDYCTKMFKSGVWTYQNEDPAKAAQDLQYGPGGTGKYEEAWSQRMRVDGNPNFKAPSIHEVWEYHDGDQVVTVLNRECIVQQGPNPAWHNEFPFQVFRPTRLGGRMVGIGVVEPIVDLQEEINTLRSQRRDNATITLQRSFFYTEGFIDPGDFKIGPGLGIPVQGDVRDAIMPVPIGDIPNSGYQEESALLADIQRTTGVDDTASGSGSVQQTATGTQLVYQAQSARTKLMTMNLETECVRAAGRQFGALNQQKIRSNRDVRVPAIPEPGMPDQRWAWVQIGPSELAGEFDYDVEGGSLAPENVPQNRQDAQTWMGLSQNPAINPSAAMAHAVRLLGVDRPEAYLAPPQPQIPVQVIDQIGQMLQGAGIDPKLFAQAKNAALSPPKK
jgi:hypothetical protein